ncbi:type I restriction enzyme S subunit [Lipingzhangella halophila]|uniref:Type I restriction enzyme S subunit n=1 Tax=Lipingzhangella halophila TaxID=1783352 RepID=A0A7W7RMQ7_9ACTN|nr:restriction endonuclease subunit S [Lipingzhangella halophila]MBB4934824.1 type I restriction enzyme S subunit [Lipingzhangella halophila]
MSDWHRTTIGDVLTFQRGFDITRSQQRPGNVPVVSSGGVASYHDTPMATGPGVVIGRKGTLGKVFYLASDYWPHDTTLWVKDFKGNDPGFVYYFLRTLDLLAMDTGSSHPTLNRNHVHPLAIHWTSLRNQQAIAATLGALDKKIATNDRALETSRELMEAVFLGAAKETREVRRISSIAEFHNRRRVPLSARHRKTVQGVYPYYGAAGAIDYVNDYIFSGPHLLVGEDGTVTEDGSRPMTQYVWGDFWVSNHAHVLTGTEVSTELLAVAVRTGDVSPLVTGAAQPKLSMRNLSSLEVALPPADSRAGVADSCSALWAVVRSRTAESRTLAELRDTLLPQLMSGKLRVKDAERVVEKAV